MIIGQTKPDEQDLPIGLIEISFYEYDASVVNSYVRHTTHFVITYLKLRIVPVISSSNHVDFFP